MWLQVRLKNKSMGINSANAAQKFAYAFLLHSSVKSAMRYGMIFVFVKSIRMREKKPPMLFLFLVQKVHTNWHVLDWVSLSFNQFTVLQREYAKLFCEVCRNLWALVGFQGTVQEPVLQAAHTLLPAGSSATSLRLSLLYVYVLQSRKPTEYSFHLCRSVLQTVFLEAVLQIYQSSFRKRNTFFYYFVFILFLALELSQPLYLLHI